MTKIETIGTCSKSKLSSKGTNGPLGVKIRKIKLPTHVFYLDFKLKHLDSKSWSFDKFSVTHSKSHP